MVSVCPKGRLPKPDVGFSMPAAEEVGFEAEKPNMLLLPVLLDAANEDFFAGGSWSPIPFAGTAPNMLPALWRLGVPNDGFGVEVSEVVAAPNRPPAWLAVLFAKIDALVGTSGDAFSKGLTAPKSLAVPDSLGSSVFAPNKVEEEKAEDLSPAPSVFGRDPKMLGVPGAANVGFKGSPNESFGVSPNEGFEASPNEGFGVSPNKGFDVSPNEGFGVSPNMDFGVSWLAPGDGAPNGG